jgi:hypothetical protein
VAPTAGATGRGWRDGAERQKIWNQRKKLFSPRKSLKTLKTAKGIFGKACRIQAENLEMFGDSLEKFASD